MAAMVVVNMAIVVVIDMVFVQHCLMATTKAMDVSMLKVDRMVFRFGVARCRHAFVWTSALVNVATVNVMMVSIVLIVDVAVMVFCDVAAVWSVHVAMIAGMDVVVRGRCLGSKSERECNSKKN
jgi:hypothetical protein